MITPQLEELLALRSAASQLGLTTNQRVRAPLSGLYASVFRGQGMDFDEVRAYQPGDEIRNIDWRVTARMGKPYLKVYREERDRGVMLCVDTSYHMQFGTRGTFKAVQAARVAALLGWSAHGHGDKVGGMLFGQQRPYFFSPTRTHQAFVQLLQQLTHPPDATATSSALPQALKFLTRTAATGGLVFVIADLYQVTVEELKEPLTQLRQRQEVVLIAIDDPADSHLPTVGEVNLQAKAGQYLVVDTDNVAIRQAYQQLWQQHREELKSLTQKLHIHFFNVSTQQSVYQTLLAGLRQRLYQEQAHR